MPDISFLWGKKDSSSRIYGEDLVLNSFLISFLKYLDTTRFFYYFSSIPLKKPFLKYLALFSKLGHFANIHVLTKDVKVAQVLASKNQAAVRIYSAVRNLINPRKKILLQHKVLYQRKKK